MTAADGCGGASAAAVRAVPGPVVLLAGGTDKNIDFSPLRDAVTVPRAVVLLAGTGTEKIRLMLDEAHVPFDGPFDDLRKALVRSLARAREVGGESGASLLFSPGCTSFGMFLNEFDRGRKFKEIAAELTPGEEFSP